MLSWNVWYFEKKHASTEIWSRWNLMIRLRMRWTQGRTLLVKVKSKMISNLPWCVVDLFCSFSPPPAPGPLIVGIKLKQKFQKNEPSICRHYLAYNISSAFQIVENGYNLKRGPNNLKPKHFIYLNGCPEMSIWSVLCVEKQKIKVTAIDGYYSRTLLYKVFFFYNECCAFSC